MISFNKKYFLKENVRGEEVDNASLTITKKDNVLVFDFEIIDDSIFSPYKEDNDDIYNGDTVEVFITFDEDISKYYEYELSPFGVRFYGYIENPTLESPILTKIEPKFKGKAILTDNGYKASIEIDIGSFDINNIRFNCFNIDSDEGREQKLYSLNPTLSNTFHKSKFFVKFN